MGQNEIRVSVVTPICNVENYLAQCLDSLLAQDMDGIEFICIDDGSTDGSGTILREYADRDARIRAVFKENSGYGATMNLGLDQACGEYVGIVESDDFIEPSMMRRLYKMAKKHDADLVKCNYYAHYDGRDHRFANFKGFPYGKRLDPADNPRIACTVPAIWTGLYRRSFLQREGIRFRETPGAAFQDAAFSLKAWFAARACALVRRPLLHYRMDNPASSSVAVSDKPFMVVDELADAERFLRERSQRAERFVPWFHVDKLGKYRWSYERIVPEHRERFAKIMRDEYLAAQQAGELDLGLFAPQDSRLLRELLREGAQTFAAAHSDSF